MHFYLLNIIEQISLYYSHRIEWLTHANGDFNVKNLSMNALYGNY